MQFTSVSHLFSMIKPSHIQNINLGYLNRESHSSSNIQLDIKRDDQLHPVVSGNKWRKLKYLLIAIEQQGFNKVATMGGAYSNFIHSLAYCCHLLGWQCDLYIRAYPEQPLTSTLVDCKKWSANVTYVNREAFRALRTKPPKLEKDVFWINEGGLQKESLLGLKEIFMEFEQQYDFIIMASATGTSIAGLVEGAKLYQADAKIMGISVLNNSVQQRNDIEKLTQVENEKWEIIDGYKFGGFAKSNKQLNDFIKSFVSRYQITLEPLYSGKSFYGVFDLIKNKHFPPQSKILLIHCGGLQGTRLNAYY
jgi:1-aminocyclopropane-1-carboxylate deaminase